MAPTKAIAALTIDIISPEACPRAPAAFPTLLPRGRMLHNDTTGNPGQDKYADEYSVDPSYSDYYFNRSIFSGPHGPPNYPFVDDYTSYMNRTSSFNQRGDNPVFVSVILAGAATFIILCLSFAVCCCAGPRTRSGKKSVIYPLLTAYCPVVVLTGTVWVAVEGVRFLDIKPEFQVYPILYMVHGLLMNIGEVLLLCLVVRVVHGRMRYFSRDGKTVGMGVRRVDWGGVGVVCVAAGGERAADIVRWWASLNRMQYGLAFAAEKDLLTTKLAGIVGVMIWTMFLTSRLMIKKGRQDVLLRTFLYVTLLPLLTRSIYMLTAHSFFRASSWDIRPNTTCLEIITYIDPIFRYLLLIPSIIGFIIIAKRIDWTRHDIVSNQKKKTIDVSTGGGGVGNGGTSALRIVLGGKGAETYNIYGRAWGLGGHGSQEHVFGEEFGDMNGQELGMIVRSSDDEDSVTAPVSAEADGAAGTATLTPVVTEEMILTTPPEGTAIGGSDGNVTHSGVSPAPGVSTMRPQAPPSADSIPPEIIPISVDLDNPAHVADGFVRTRNNHTTQSQPLPQPQSHYTRPGIRPTRNPSISTSTSIDMDNPSLYVADGFTHRPGPSTADISNGAFLPAAPIAPTPLSQSSTYSIAMGGAPAVDYVGPVSIAGLENTGSGAGTEERVKENTAKPPSESQSPR